MHHIKRSIVLFTTCLSLGLTQMSFACDTFDPGNDTDECLSSCVNAGCDTANAGCSAYCGMQTFSPE